jgi:hypothetical protein
MDFENSITFRKSDVCDSAKASITASTRASETGRRELNNTIWATYESAPVEISLEPLAGGAIEETTSEANREDPKARRAKIITDLVITRPAKALSCIKVQVELKMITNTITGERKRNPAMKALTITENRLILIGET